MSSINDNKNIKRLEAIANMVDFDSSIADIGSDHCYVPIICAKQKKIVFAQAIENKKGPYNRMVNAIKSSGFSSIIEPSLSDGLNELNEKVDSLVIAGMGGKLIISILEKGKEKLDNIKTIITDAHNDRPDLIKYMESIGYHIDKNEFLYEGGIAYDVMKWVKGKPFNPYTDNELVFGPLNLINKSEPWKTYWKNEASRLSNLISNNKLPNNKKDQYQKSINLINEVLN